MTNPIKDIVQLGFPWVGLDPFIMTVHHVDDYPAGDRVSVRPARRIDHLVSSL